MTDRPHPHFDDKGTLEWFPTLHQALARAKETGKRVLIEFGREA